MPTPKRFKIEYTGKAAIAAKPATVEALPPSPTVGDDPLVTIPAFAAVAFGDYSKKAVKKIRHLLAAGVLPYFKLGAKPKPGKRDLRRIHIPLHSGRAALMASGGVS